MKREAAWRRYLRFWGPSAEDDVDDEFRFHLETRIQELQAQGLSAEAARREALRQFGPVAAARAECVAISRNRERRVSWIDYLNGWAGDLRYAVRVLRRAKASTAAAILILAVGIGATTALFTVVDRVLYRPLPVPRPSELALVSHWSPSPNGTHLGVTFTDAGYAWLRDHNAVFTGLAAETIFNARERRAHEKIERPARAVMVSENFFDILGVRPLAGRGLARGEDRAHVAVAGYRFAARRYEEPADALGKTVYLNDLTFTIVGVMPPGFYGTQKGYDPDLYVPLGCTQELIGATDLGVYLRPIGRLRPGVDRARAESNLQILWKQFEATGPASDPKGDRISCDSGARGYDTTGEQRRRSLGLLGGIVVLLLLIACANVACLLIARGAARQHETAIRLSLGGGRLRILRQPAVESLILALAGGAGALLVAHGAAGLLLAGFHWDKRPIAYGLHLSAAGIAVETAVDGRVLAFAVGLSIASAVLFGLAPAVQLLRGGRVPLHRGPSLAPFAPGKVLVVLEVALSLVLVAGAAVFVRSFQNLRAVPTGFVAEHVSVVRLVRNTDDEASAPPAREAALLADSLRGARGVEAAGLSNLLMFNDGYTLMSLRLPVAQQITSAHVVSIGRGYFETLRIALIAGRDMTQRDAAPLERVAVITESLAHKLFPGQIPLGKHILLGRAVRDPKPGDETEVVGVVKDTKFTSVAQPAPDVVYISLLQGETHSAGIVLEIRSPLDPPAVGALAAARIRAAHLPLAVQSVTALADEIGASLADDSIRMQASTLFGGLALALIASGIYGLIAYSVARRTREIGIRMAVGSRPSAIVGLVVRESLGLVAVGVALGIPGAVAVMRAVSGMVFGLPPVDYPSLAIAAALLAVAGLAASGGPAWRAAHLDPMKALRVQ